MFDFAVYEFIAKMKFHASGVSQNTLLILKIHTVNHNVLSLSVKHNEHLIPGPKGKNEFCFQDRSGKQI